jgi:hypothetical protein
MLNQDQIEYLKHYQEQHEQAEKSADFNKLANLRQMNKRIREKALQEIEDLTLIAKYFPEEQLDQIFKKDKMRDLIENILNAKATVVDNPKYGSAQILNTRTFGLGILLAAAGTKVAYRNVHQKLRIIAHGRGGSVELSDQMAFILNIKNWADKELKPSEFDIGTQEVFPFLKDAKHLAPRD